MTGFCPDSESLAWAVYNFFYAMKPLEELEGSDTRIIPGRRFKDPLKFSKDGLKTACDVLAFLRALFVDCQTTFKLEGHSCSEVFNKYVSEYADMSGLLKSKQESKGARKQSIFSVYSRGTQRGYQELFLDACLL